MSGPNRKMRGYKPNDKQLIIIQFINTYHNYSVAYYKLHGSNDILLYTLTTYNPDYVEDPKVVCKFPYGDSLVETYEICADLKHPSDIFELRENKMVFKEGVVITKI
jgi:hypothetical protein